MGTMDQQRAWRGPAIFSYGFRTFFFSSAVLALLLMALWVPVYLGNFALPAAFPPVAWHAHELLFGYGGAVIAGFLLTAVPNWTGRLPVVGWPLIGLFALWLAGRVLVTFAPAVSPPAIALVALGFPLALALVIAREIIAGKNWRNLKVLLVLGLLILAQALFHLEVWRQGQAVYGMRLGVAATVLLIMIIGGRIIPSFTLNWLRRARPGIEPRPFSAFDRNAMLLGGLALALWVALPGLPALKLPAGAVLLAAGLVQLWRGARWAPQHTLAEPLVAVLHVAHAFVPLGFLLAGLDQWTTQTGLGTAALHAWTTGAIGLMTLAVMTRASRGHSGHPLTAPPSTVAVYAAITLAALSRVLLALWPAATGWLLPFSGLAWMAGFLGFLWFYGPMLLTRRA